MRRAKFTGTNNVVTFHTAIKDAASNADKAINDKLLNQLGDKSHVEFWK